MLILRQKQFSPQDFVGATTARQVKNIKDNRIALAGLKIRGQKRNKQWLERKLAKLDSIDGMTGGEYSVARENLVNKYNRKNDRMQRRRERLLKIGNIASTPGAFIRGQWGRGTYTKTTTKSNPSQFWKNNGYTVGGNTSSNLSVPSTTETTTQQQNNNNNQGVSVLQGLKNTWGGMTGTQKNVARGIGGALAIGGTIAITNAIKNRQRRKAEEEERRNGVRRGRGGVVVVS